MDNSQDKRLEIKTALAFDEKKQAAIVGHCLKDKLFCLQAERAIRPEWFASNAVSKVFKAVMKLYNQYHRVPTVEEVRDSREFDGEDPRFREKIPVALTDCVKQAETYKLDLLRDEITHWMHAVIFSTAVTKAVTAYNGNKPNEAWSIMDDAMLLKSGSSFEDGTLQEFEKASDWLDNEFSEREAEAPHRVNYNVGFLNDCLRGISRTEVVLIGAYTGVGKSQLGMNLAVDVSCTKKIKNGVEVPRKVHFLALEAERGEVQRRIKFGHLASAYHNDLQKPKEVLELIESGVPLNFNAWRKFEFGHLLDKYEDQVAPLVREKLENLNVLYRVSGDFGIKTLEKKLVSISQESDLIVLDHIHYIDVEDDENKEYKRVIKAVRDVALKYRVPIVVVAHIRKNQNPRKRQLLPAIDDFMGTSDIPKVSTTCVVIGRRPESVPKDADDTLDEKEENKAFGKVALERHLSPTLMHVVKFRLDGDALRHTAMVNFNTRTGTYEDDYKLGVLTRGNTEWIPTPRDKWPDWAKYSPRATVGDEDDAVYQDD